MGRDRAQRFSEYSVMTTKPDRVKTSVEARLGAAPGLLGGKSFPGLRGALLRWYDENGRDLPWRNTRDPYRIWLSEVMLQQTRVAAVLEHYRTFLERFPDIASLAAASETLSSPPGAALDTTGALACCTSARDTSCRFTPTDSRKAPKISRLFLDREVHCRGHRQHRIRRAGGRG